MQRILRANEMKAWDAHTIETVGIPSAVLMERAAMAVAEEALRMLEAFPKQNPRVPQAFFEKNPRVRGIRSERNPRVLVLAGSGNNGGDGYACARILHLKGVTVQILETGNPEHRTEETERQAGICGKLGIPMLRLSAAAEGELRSAVAHTDLFVDAMLGIGLTREVTGELAALIQKVNASGKPVVAVDTPSGIDADTGAVLGCAIRADMTVTMAYEKPGLLLYPGALYAGQIQVAEIGIVVPCAEQTQAAEMGASASGDPLDASDGNESPIYSLEASDVRALLPERRPDGNKGTFGKVLVIAGSKNMAGAAILCAGAVLRTGAGMVKVLTPELNRSILQCALPEALLATYVDEQEALRELRSALDWCDAVACGPGLGTGEIAGAILKVLLSECAEHRKPLVLDADALNLMARSQSGSEEDLSVLSTNAGSFRCPEGAEIWITPHVGEMSRLTGESIGNIKANLIQAARKFAVESGAACALKDARTVVASPDGTVYINRTGNSGMATAGSGDVLTGILSSLLAQGAERKTAAPLAVYLHGAAGDKASRVKGERSMKAGDIVESIGDRGTDPLSRIVNTEGDKGSAPAVTRGV